MSKLDHIPDCARCGASACPEDKDALWDARKQGRWLRGVKFMRADVSLNRSEFICMECGSTFSEPGLLPNWAELELLAVRPEEREQKAAIESRLQPECDDPDIPEEMLGEMREVPDDLHETTAVPTIKEAIAEIYEENPEVIEKALPWQEQLKRLLQRRPDLVKE